MITVNFRTLAGKSYSFETDPSAKISDIDFSSKIPNYLPTSKFIYRGTNLQNSTQLSSLNLAPHDFIVIYNQTQYIKRPHQPEDINVSIEDEFEEPQAQTRIFKSPDHPSVQPLPDISRPTDLGVQIVRDVLDPTEIAGMSESLYGSPALPHLYEAISRDGICEDDDDDDYDDDENENEDNAANYTENVYEANDTDANVQPQENQMFYGIEGSETLTNEDKQVITRLQKITNLDVITIVQVFLACDKEETTTANCLLSMMN